MQIYKSLDEVVERGSIAPDSIINADCLEAMKFIPDKSIDCIICDLPFTYQLVNGIIGVLLMAGKQAWILKRLGFSTKKKCGV